MSNSVFIFHLGATSTNRWKVGVGWGTFYAYEGPQSDPLGKENPVTELTRRLGKVEEGAQYLQRLKGMLEKFFGNRAWCC